MHFDGDAFISYAHLDNQELIEGRKGWVANLHRALEIRVGQLLGKSPQIWRDPKLTGNDFFADALVERLRRVAVLISVVSPRYVKSEWARRELDEFWKAAEQQGGVRVRDRSRVFKVLKTPVPIENTPNELRALLGYEFFRIDQETGKVRELDEVFGPEAQREFWMKLDDLAHDIGSLLEVLEGPNIDDRPAERGTVYLAETTSDLREEHQALRRELQQHGYAVLPSQPLPLEDAAARAAIASDLTQCQLSVHLLGSRYGVVPEGGTDSLGELQNALAIDRSGGGTLSRLIWIPRGLRVDEPRQSQLIDRIRMDPQIARGDLLETYFEDLRTAVHEWLDRINAEAAPAVDAPSPAPGNGQTVAAAPTAAPPRLYLIHDQRDLDAVGPCVDYLFNQSLEVVRPIFEGDEREIREEHEENLRQCDAVLIVLASGNEIWLRRKLREIQKSAGFGRTMPAPPIGIALMPPRTPDKERLRTHEATIIPLWDGCDPASLGPFVDLVKGAGRKG